VETQKLVASDGAAGDHFSESVSVSGDTALVGAAHDGDLGQYSGSAYIFENVGGVWTQTAKLLASDGAAEDRFGSRVSVSSDTALVVAMGDDDLGQDSGSAYVFERVGGVWSQTTKLLASDGAAGDSFGYSVAVSGETVLVGVMNDDDRGENSGSAYVFEKVGGVWTQTAKLLASDGAAEDWFGYSVAISGETAFVGARQDDDSGVDSGSAYVFERVGGVWTQTAKLLAADGDDGDSFGYSVSVSGEAALVGANSDDDLGNSSGSAYMFERGGGEWMQTKLLAADGAAYDSFGCAVSIAGDRAIVGARSDDDGASNSGSAYIFENVGGAWGQTAKLMASDGAPDDWFGWSVSVSGGTAVVAARLDDDGGQDSGSAYVFDLCPSCPADFNGDGTVNTLDVLAFLNAWAAGDSSADFDDNGAIDTRDVLAFLNAWTAGC